MPDKSRRHHPLTVVLYVLTGLGLLMACLPIWDDVAPYRVPLLVLVVLTFIVLQAIDWRRMRTDRLDRRKRWGLRKELRVDGGEADESRPMR